MARVRYSTSEQPKGTAFSPQEFVVKAHGGDWRVIRQLGWDVDESTQEVLKDGKVWLFGERNLAEEVCEKIREAHKSKH